MSDDFDKDLKRLDDIRSTVRLAASTTDVVFLLSFIDKLWNEYSRTLQKVNDLTKRPKPLRNQVEAGPVTLDDLKRAIAAVEQAWKDDSTSDYVAAALRAEAWRTAFWWHASLAQRARQDMRQSLQELSDGMQLIGRLP